MEEKLNPADVLAGRGYWSCGLERLLLGMFWVVNVFPFPSCRVFALRLPLSDKLTGLGIAINSLSVFLI